MTRASARAVRFNSMMELVSASYSSMPLGGRAGTATGASSTGLGVGAEALAFPFPFAEPPRGFAAGCFLGARLRGAAGVVADASTRLRDSELGQDSFGTSICTYAAWVDVDAARASLRARLRGGGPLVVGRLGLHGERSVFSTVMRSWGEHTRCLLMPDSRLCPVLPLYVPGGL